jgi:hypothetical protein
VTVARKAPASSVEKQRSAEAAAFDDTQPPAPLAAPSAAAATAGEWSTAKRSMWATPLPASGRDDAATAAATRVSTLRLRKGGGARSATLGGGDAQVTDDWLSKP